MSELSAEHGKQIKYERRQELEATLPYQSGYLSLRGAARYASVSSRTIKRWIRAGLPVYQGTLRGKVLIRPSDIDAYLTRRQSRPSDLDAMVADVLVDLVSQSTSVSEPIRPRGRWARA